MLNIRPSAVGGTFYPGNAVTLSASIDAMLEEAVRRNPPAEIGSLPKVIIVPHAGYIYSGPVAASAFSLIRGGKGTINRVVLVGPVHRVPVKGVALSSASFFETPLGMIPLDSNAAQELADVPEIIVSDAAHGMEHSLEVQLPFLQRVLGEFSLIPLAVGDTGAGVVAQLLERLWGGPETLIVISTDFSHYKSYEAARIMDDATIQSLLNLQLLTSYEQACGALPVNGLIVAARHKGLVPRLIDVRNSGDTAGDKDRVVGYASLALYEKASVQDDRGRLLLAIARATLSSRFGILHAVDESAPWLAEPGACFVTLTKGGELRGCIGSLEPYRPLLQDLKQNALAAAFRDPRFPALELGELDKIRVEVSLLSSVSTIIFSDEADALAQLRPGIDGVIFEYGANRGTFLPQVWEQVPHPRDFFMHLKLKAGLKPDFWDNGVRLSRYTVKKYKEELI